MAICYLHDVLKISAEETVVICPVDPYVENEYFAALEELSKLAEQEETGLVLLGITLLIPVKNMVISFLKQMQMSAK